MSQDLKRALEKKNKQIANFLIASYDKTKTISEILAEYKKYKAADDHLMKLYEKNYNTK